MSSTPAAQPFSGKQNDTEEMQQVVEVILNNSGRAIVDETRSQDELRSRGFGEKEGREYLLKPYEVLYLLHTKRLAISGKPDMLFDSLFQLLLRHDRNIMTRFLVYRDLRSRGYVAKEGFGFGVDFRVYERGDYEKKPAKYVVFGINEGANVTSGSFASNVEQIEKMGKESVVAVIERRGDVIYYKASKMRFMRNRYDALIRK